MELLEHPYAQPSNRRVRPTFSLIYALLVGGLGCTALLLENRQSPWPALLVLLPIWLVSWSLNTRANFAFYREGIQFKGGPLLPYSALDYCWVEHIVPPPPRPDDESPPQPVVLFFARKLDGSFVKHHCNTAFDYTCTLFQQYASPYFRPPSSAIDGPPSQYFAS
jgi:hypothetical protein